MRTYRAYLIQLLLHLFQMFCGLSKKKDATYDDKQYDVVPTGTTTATYAAPQSAPYAGSRLSPLLSSGALLKQKLVPRHFVLKIRFRHSFKERPPSYEWRLVDI